MNPFSMLIAIAALLAATAPASAAAQTSVGLYDVFEKSVTNSKTYSNPFDFNVIDLRTTFTAPSGGKTNFFGFYDGGTTWKFRFMPTEVGNWTYTWTWSDGTAGGSGSFTVTDTGLPGPLRTDPDPTWYWENARGEPFHFRGYDMHVMARYSPNHNFIQDKLWVLNKVQTNAIAPGYNFVMLTEPNNRKRTTDQNCWLGNSWWANTTDTKRFNPELFQAFEEAIKLMKDNKVYVIGFATFIYQGDQYAFADFKVFLHYWVARMGAFYNDLGWSPTWEWADIWTPTDVTNIMSYLRSIDPWKRPLTAHDCANSTFSGWLDFSMRQKPSRTIFDGNGRQKGQKQGACDAPGGVAAAFVNKPILASEDIWEVAGATNNQPRNKDEVRRAAWGIMMAGVMPIYSEWNGNPPSPNGTGEGEVKRMFDFYYSKIGNYRKHKQLNNVVSASAGQIASGIAGSEYLVYDQNGGNIAVNLAGASGTFSVLWYDPKTGNSKAGSNVEGGASRTFTSPFSGDAVLFLKKGLIPAERASSECPRTLVTGAVEVTVCRRTTTVTQIEVLLERVQTRFKVARAAKAKRSRSKQRIAVPQAAQPPSNCPARASR